MKKELERLLSCCGDILSESPPHATVPPVLLALKPLIDVANGFYAYDGALLVRPVQSLKQPLGVAEWNVASLWKNTFRNLHRSIIFFAEDIFGNQFGIVGATVHSFDPESGDLREVGSLEDWLRALVHEPEVVTGWPLARAWQRSQGPLPLGFRLVPKVPFILGGKYEVSNLRASPDAESMRARSVLANEIADVPDGTSVVLRKKLRDA